MEQKTIFDGSLSEQLKTSGMAKAEDNSSYYLNIAREAAKRIALSRGTVTADDVGRYLKRFHGIDTLGPAAGSLFKTKDFVFTGEFRKSSRITNHSRLLRVWRLK